MPNHAIIMITGHLGGKIELNHLPANGTAVLKFSLCVNTGYGDKKHATWYNCAMFGNRAEKLQGMLEKGQAVTVVGEPSLREYSTDSGKRYSLDVRVQDVVLLGGKRDDSALPGGSEEVAPVDGGSVENDIPF